MISRIRTIAKKESKQVMRDTRTLIALVIVPLFLLVMFGYAISTDVKNITMAVFDEDNTSISRGFVSAFVNSSYFERVRTLSSASEIEGRMASEEFKAAILIPRDFSKNVILGTKASYQTIVDGSNSNIAATIVGYINAVTQSYSFNLVSKNIRSRLRGTVSDTAGFFSALSLPVDVRFRTWYNPELKSSFFLVPGLIAFIMVVSSVLATSLSIVREKERGSMEQLLVSPVLPIELVIGKTIPYILLTLTTATGILIASYVFFGIVIKGSVLLLFACTLLFLFGSLGLGILISTIADSQQVAFMLSSTITMLPTFILSGFVFPIRNMPLILQIVTYAIPSRYYLSTLRSIILKGAGIDAIWPDMLGLVIFALITVSFGVVRLHREMEA